MAHKRMFSKDITESDAFADMPLSSQALYFHLGMEADDMGFVNNAKKVQRGIGASPDDLNLLIAKRFIIPFESGIVVIKHWKVNNTIKSDRNHGTKYEDELAMLDVKDNGVYTLKNVQPELVVSNLAPTSVQNGSLDIGIDIGIGIEEKRDTLSGKPDYSSQVREIVAYLNAVVGSRYKPTTRNTVAHIKARLKAGFTVEDFKAVIDKKAAAWKGDPKMAKYLRPETLFGPKFEGYLNELTVKRGGANGRFSKYD